VEFEDGSVLGQLGFPSMELPILYALTHPARLADQGVRRFDPVSAGSLTFEPLRREAFRAFGAGVEAGRAGGTAPAAFNAANEVAVGAFLAGRIPFGRIAEVIEATLADQAPVPATSLDAVRAADARSRAAAERLAR
jgi:1-deoxy-D-xylulose-5-phosphate reductoisomerase